jgi:predicted nucleotidyltransferase
MLQTQTELPMDEIRAICRRYQVREPAVFGSVLRDGFRPDSDVDFLVEFQPEARASCITLFRMEDEFSEAVSRPVDLVPKGGLNPTIRGEVLAQAVVVYQARDVSGSDPLHTHAPTTS